MDNYSHSKVQNITIDYNTQGQRLDNYLIKTLKGVPKSHIYRIIRSGQIRINSKRVKAHTRLMQNDLLRIPPIVHKNPQDFVVNESLADVLNQSIIYQDDYLIAINKPSGLAVHSGSGVDIGVIEIMRQLHGKNLELVHRIDKDTSGVLLIAVNRESTTKMHALLREQEITKMYKLCVWNKWPAAIKTVSVPLNKIMTASGEAKMQVDKQDGDTAITKFRLEESYPCASLLTAQLVTGKTHQIRLHAAHHNCPIISDKKYGDYAINKYLAKNEIHKLMLHAWQVKFSHPFTEQPTTITAAVSREFKQQLKVIRTLELETGYK